ncbi:MAG: gamma-glutamyl-gamma-aminobutyrate hydrolase family protein [Gemmatimonadota bacterium]
MNRPLIAISGSIRRYDGTDRAGVNAAYARSIAQAGGIPIILTPAIGAEAAAQALAPVQGLILTGGHDVDPQHYEAPPSPALGPLDPARDDFELALFGAARQRKLPVLGICRGLQVINVALGGTLWQDLPSERPGAIQHDSEVSRNARTHHVLVKEPSHLAQALGTGKLVTNSFHHQAIRDLAPGLQVTAWAEDGVIEGVEETGTDGWLLAVQWHPEEFHQEPGSADQLLFHALVGAASASPGRRAGWETAPGRLHG